jgi:hypothetical protein
MESLFEGLYADSGNYQPYNLGPSILVLVLDGHGPVIVTAVMRLTRFTYLFVLRKNRRQCPDSEHQGLCHIYL